jgi:hypothetical protein
MKHHLLYWCSFITICMFGLFACPSIQTISLNIDGAELKDGSLRGQSFDLSVYGQGFGISNIAYDLSKQTGQAEKPAYQFRIVSQNGSFLAFSEGSQIEVLSTTEMTVNFIVQTPLEFGEYDLELTLAGENGDPLDTLRNGIKVVDDTVMVMDASVTDQGVEDVTVIVDTGNTNRPDAGPDGGIIVDDAGQPSRLGPWVGNYRYRREVVVSNPSGDQAPGGITIRIPIPHGDHVAAGQAQDDATDVAIYWNSQQLQFQWENRAIPNTPDLARRNQLVMIAKLPDTDPIPTGLLQQAVLVLYFGDENATPDRSDDVFDFVERFDGNLMNWNVNQWARACPDRLGGPNGSYCVGDSNANPHRRTLASPNSNISGSNPGNVVYEVEFWFAGTMQGPRDLIYFAYGPSANDFTTTTLLPNMSYDINPPTHTVDFTETNGMTRVVSGWKLANSPGQTWTVSRARLSPTFDNASFHVRFISADAINEEFTNVAFDDLTLRKALSPDFEVSLAPTETRQ